MPYYTTTVKKTFSKPSILLVTSRNKTIFYRNYLRTKIDRNSKWKKTGL